MEDDGGQACLGAQAAGCSHTGLLAGGQSKQMQAAYSEAATEIKGACAHTDKHTLIHTNTQTNL